MSNGWEEFRQEAVSAKRLQGPRCGVEILMKTLPGEARPYVEAALADESLSASSIERSLRVRIGNEAPSAWVIRNHRRNGCRCGRNA